MAVRALIVAIEKYPKASGLATELPGTNDAARSFCKWLAEKKGVAPKGSPGYNPRTFFCCAAKDVEFRTHGTTRDQIVRALESLEKAAKEDLASGTAATEELYCFFSGHGICYPRNETVQDDLFIASDFINMKKSGAACVKVTELIDLLRPALGPGDHYYFFDYCRTEVKFGEITPTGLGVLFDRVQAEFPGQAILFSVAQGMPARTDSGFAKHLVDGLSGKGRAKGWYREDLYVKFDFLRDYLKRATKQTVDGQLGSGDGLILKVEPIPAEPCRIRVQDAAPSDRFRFEITRRHQPILGGEFDGAEHTVTVDLPGDYQVEVTHPEATVERVKPPAAALVDLYDPAEVLFRKLPEGLESFSTPLPAEGILNVRGAPNTAIRLRSAQDIGGVSEVFAGDSLSRSLLPGDYVVEIEEAGQPLARQTVSVTAGRTVEADPLAGPSSALRERLLEFFPRDGHSVDFSESLGGTTADRDIGLWLSLIAASRVVGREGGREFSKLGKVPLKANFEAVRPGRAALFVLAGFEGLSGPYAIGVGKDPEWTEMTPVDGVEGLYEFAIEVEPGPKLVSFQRKGGPWVTLSTYALANRASLYALSNGGGLAPLDLYQFLLPIHALSDALPLELRWRVDLIPPLRTTRFIVNVERLFARDHSITRIIDPASAPIDAELRHQYDDLIDAKWLDPVASLIAANDLLRRGVTGARPDLAGYRRVLETMVVNFRLYFEGIPDAEALAKATGAPWKLPTAPPLLADSLTAFNREEQQAFMPFSNDRRQFGIPWVAWVGAVKPFFG
jgi:hypothetical protein